MFPSLFYDNRKTERSRNVTTLATRLWERWQLEARPCKGNETDKETPRIRASCPDDTGGTHRPHGSPELARAKRTNVSPGLEKKGQLNFDNFIWDVRELLRSFLSPDERTTSSRTESEWKPREVLQVRLLSRLTLTVATLGNLPCSFR